MFNNSTNSSKTKSEHILHFYKKVPNTKEQYMCMDPDCTHREFKKFLLNKRARCPICGNDYIMTRDSFRRIKLKCKECSTRKKTEVKQIDKLANKVFINVPD